MTSITSSLGAGSGIDTTALVQSLVDAQFQAKNTLLTKREEALTAQISAVSELKSGITGFSGALTALVRGGTLSTQPTSGNAGIVAATLLPGARIGGTAATVEVVSLATAQVNASALHTAGARVGTGTLRLTVGNEGGGNEADGTVGGTTFPDIVIGEGDATLAGIASRINTAKTGVTASVVADATGERLVLKGATGAASAFRVEVVDGTGDGGLAGLSAGPQGAMSSNGTAADAVVKLDGVALRRPSNTVTGLIPGIKLDLVSAQPGVAVAIGTTPPTEALRQAVSDVVATFNDFHGVLAKAIDPVGGALRSDPGATALKQALAALTLTPLTTGVDGPATLAELGIATNRDGTLSLDTVRLTKALTEHPAAVEAIFMDGTGASGRGLSGALGAISVAASSMATGLGASAQRYTARQTALDDEQAKALEQADAMRTRMTQQFAAMDARVAAYKSTQTFLEQQIDAWNRAD